MQADVTPRPENVQQLGPHPEVSPAIKSDLWSLNQFQRIEGPRWWRDMHTKLLNTFTVASSSGSSLAYLDGIRGVAVALVVIYHCWVLSGAPNVLLSLPLTNARVNLVPFLSTGYIGVDLFFVLSGFLLSQYWLKADFQDKPRPSTRRFFRHRLLRIVPGYYCCLLLMLVLLTPSLIPPVLVYSPLGLFILSAHLLFLQYIFPISSASYSINGALWTLTMEAIFYLVLPIAILLFVKNRWMYSLPFLTAFTLLWLYLSRHSLGPLVHFLQGTVARYGVDDTIIRYFLSKQFPAHFVDFGLGITLANLVVRRGIEREVGRLFSLLTNRLAGKVYFILGWIIVVFYVKRIVVSGPVFSYYLSEIAVAIGFTFVLAGLVFAGNIIQGLFSFTPLRLLGIIGFSAYLWHMPIIFLLLKYPEIAILAPIQRFPTVLWHTAVLLIVVSALFYIVVEKPFLILGRKRPSVSAVISPGYSDAVDASAVPSFAEVTGSSREGKMSQRTMHR